MARSVGMKKLPIASVRRKSANPAPPSQIRFCSRDITAMQALSDEAGGSLNRAEYWTFAGRLEPARGGPSFFPHLMKCSGGGRGHVADLGPAGGHLGQFFHPPGSFGAPPQIEFLEHRDQA